MKSLDVDFGVWAFGHFEEKTPSIYYRIETPLLSLYELGVANVHMGRGSSPQRRFESQQLMMGADIALWWNQQNEGSIGIARQLKGFGAGKDEGGVLRVPPSFVYDMDDYVDYVSPFNRSFVEYGHRSFQGEEMEVGSRLVVPRDDAEALELWVDKSTQDHRSGKTFDIERNRATVQTGYEQARLAAGVTVTTERLAKVYRDQGVENVYAYPNSIREEDYHFFDLAPHEGVRIMWQGGGSHFEDWLPVKDALKRVFEENPQAKLIIWGEPFPFIHEVVKPEQYEFHPFLGHDLYLMKRHNMGIDINLAPLIDTTFNNCKSAIKWYEASIGPHPEITVASKVPPYSDEIVDGETGLLYADGQEFYEKLTAAIKNVSLRQTIAQRAKEWVHANRRTRVTGVGLYEFYTELRKRRRMEALAI